jgi:hypothetical protein
MKLDQEVKAVRRRVEVLEDKFRRYFPDLFAEPSA